MGNNTVAPVRCLNMVTARIGKSCSIEVSSKQYRRWQRLMPAPTLPPITKNPKSQTIATSGCSVSSRWACGWHKIISFHYERNALSLTTIILIFVATVTLAFCIDSGGKTDQEVMQETQQCIKRGMQYYEDIGSFPRLSDGRIAADVVRERCSRSRLAF